MGDSEEQSASLVSSGREGRLTDLGCPDCRGVLAVEVLGEQEHMRFACQVGHAFSQESLMDAKETQVEQALWSTIETYQEIVLLCRTLEEKACDGSPETAQAYAQRGARAATLIKALKELLSRDGPIGAPARNVQG